MPDDQSHARKGKQMNENIPKGALMVVAVVFVAIMATWFLVLGVIQARG